jgi:hypothetical protein
MLLAAEGHISCVRAHETRQASLNCTPKCGHLFRRLATKIQSNSCIAFRPFLLIAGFTGTEKNAMIGQIQRQSARVWQSLTESDRN